MILTCFWNAIAQLPDPRFRRVAILGVALTFALLFGAYALLLWFIQSVTAGPIELPLIGPVTWMGDLISFGSIVLMIILSMVLMIPVASAITSLFLDDIAFAVEAEYYPNLPPAPRVSFGDGLRDTVNFLGVLVGLNILMFLFYPFLLIFAVPAHFAMNGYLLGREYYQMVAMRRLGRVEARKSFKQNRLTVWMAGCLMAVPLAIPVVNLIIPILGAATFTHLFHQLSRR